MISLILQTATRYLLTLLLLFSVFLLLRGHNEPGGGFVGGLVCAAAFTLYAIAYDVAAARRMLRVEPRTLIGVGLSLAVLSGMLAWLAGRPFFTALWFSPRGEEGFTVGSPLLFDIGVYLTVVGATLTIVLALAEERLAQDAEN
jgi:multicomponent Na+:H+ antiporter subunit B